MPEWISENIIEIFGAVTGILYVFLEIRQNILLWPLGIITSAVYIYIFRNNGFYAGMVLQIYYLVISAYGWWEWKYGAKNFKQGAMSKEQGAAGIDTNQTEAAGILKVKRIDRKTAFTCLGFAIVLFAVLWYALDRWTDSPVPLWDGLITSLSVVATWMLTHKIIEQWYVWIIANTIAVVVYLGVAMYPTAILFTVYLAMAFAGLAEWRRSMK